MKWMHMCDPAWLNARQNFLCASEIRNLIPKTKTGRPRVIDDNDRLEIFANKMQNLTVDDCISLNAAARGHMLEPYAVEEFNKLGIAKKFFHWDDAIIAQYPDQMFSLAFSPDALTIPQHEGHVVIDQAGWIHKYSILEIKSYGLAKHIEAICSDKMQLEERWQIATAMVVDDEIEQAFLMFFNPSLKEMSIGIHEYSRNDLIDEMKVIDEVYADWITFINKDPRRLTPNPYYNSSITEDDIIRIEEEKARLNPPCA